MGKFLGFLNKYKFLLISVIFIILSAVIIVISLNRGDELLNEISGNSDNNKVGIYESEVKNEKIKICLTYIDIENKKLVEEYREINLMDYIVNEKMVLLEEYIKGSNNPNYISSIPGGTLINKVSTENGITNIDFKEICGENEKLKDIDNTLRLDSIINTMKQLKEIEKLSFSVDQKKIEKFCNITGFDKEY